MIDVLYEDMKSLFITSVRKVGIYKEYKNNSKSATKDLEDTAKHGLIMNMKFYVSNICPSKIN